MKRNEETPNALANKFIAVNCKHDNGVIRRQWMIICNDKFSKDTHTCLVLIRTHQEEMGNV